jgi:serpin B
VTDFTDPATAVRQINEWIAQRTQGAMQDVLRSVGVLSPLLLNAVYFKGAWVNQFDKALTREREFHVSGQDAVRVPMMHRQAFFGYNEDANVQIIRLRYHGDATSMLILLPRQVDGLRALEDSLTSARLEEWLSGIWDPWEVIVDLPRFHLRSQSFLGKELAQHAPLAFSRNADFTGIGPAEFRLEEVVQDAFVKVNEEGTEAGAVTRLGGLCLPPPIATFVADHPFLFLIRYRGDDDEEELSLFLGRVADPSRS